MKNPTPAVALGAIVLLAAIAWGFAASGPDDAATLLALPWGRVTILDLYLALALFAAWIHHRERSWPRTLAWGAGLVVTGSLAAFLYVAIAARSSAGDRERFWHGRSAPRAEGSPHGDRHG